MAESDFHMDASSDFEPPVKAAVSIIHHSIGLPSLTLFSEEGSCKKGCCSQSKSSS